jgi:integrase
MRTRPIKSRKTIRATYRIAQPREKMFLKMANNTGRRACDIIGLQVKDVTKDAFETFYVFEKKTKKPIRLPIYHLKDEIQEYIKDMDDDDYLFQSREKDKYGNKKHITIEGMRIAIKKIFTRVGIQGSKTLHVTRKTFVYWLLISLKGDIETARQIMNHSSCKYTKFYAEWGHEEIERAMISNFKCL